MEKHMTEATTPEVQEAPVSLTIQDLTLALQILQATTARGAFKAEELTVVGGLYDRIFKFLDAAGAIQKAPEGEVAPEALAEAAAPAPKKSKAAQ
jgi:hypothetical protein